MNSLNHERSLRFHLTSLSLLAAIFFFNFLARVILSPLLPTIETDLGLTHGEAGSLFFLIACGYFVTLTGSAFVSSRWKHRHIIVLSSTAVGLAIWGTSLGHGLWTIRINLVVVGMAAGLYLPSGIATLTSLIEPRQWGKAIAIHELAPNLAFVLAPIIAETFLIWAPWRSVLQCVGLASLLIGLLFFRYARGGNFSGDPPNFESLRALKSEPAFWLMIILFGIGIGSTLGIYSMLPLYLVNEHGMDQYWANTLFGLSRVSTLATALLGGWATDRFGPKKTIGIVLGLTGIITALLGVAPSTWVVVLIFAQPLLAVSFFPAGFAVLSAIGPPGSRNLVVSFTIPLAFLMGGGITPMIIGAMGNAGYLGYGFSLVGGFILLGSLLSQSARFYK